MKYVYVNSFLVSFLLTFCGLAVPLNGQTSFNGSDDFSTYVQKNSYSDEIYFKSSPVLAEKIQTTAKGPISFDNSELLNGGIVRLIQFEKIPNESIKDDLKNAGITLLDYIPNRAFIALIPSNINYETLRSFNVDALLKLSPQHKLDKYLSNDALPDYAIQGQKFRVLLHYFSFVESSTVFSSLNNVDVLQAFEEYNSVEVLVDRTNILQLASNKYIKFIETGLAPPVPENSTGRTMHRSNTINTEYNNGLKYDGSGVTIMVQDDGNIGPHIDFEGRLNQSNIGGAGGNHGDHVTGIFMGAGNLDPKGRGMAPGAFGIVYGASNLNYNSVPAHYGLDSLRITTKSYGNGCNSGYNSIAQQLDAQVVTYPSLIHVFSTGNSGNSNCQYGAGPGWGNITGGHKSGKNVLSVASLNYTDTRTSSSSRGPATDGRLKPDIAAKGVSVYSTLGNYNYGNNSGTSMACPGVTGVLGQLYQAYRDINSGNDPNSALIKAVVLNTAEDLGNPGPDFSYGWGRINAGRAYEVLNNHHYMDSSVATAGTNIHNLSVPAGLSSLKIMLYWKDPDASIAASPALVNDLNVTVSDPSLQISQPLILNPAPNATTLNLPASPGVDNLNNMEQVVYNNPTAGNYQISVNGFQVPQGPQHYYIVYLFETDSVKLTYPIGGESLVPGETETVRWDASGNTGGFSLDYSTDNGSNWNILAPNIPGNQRYYDWTVPPTISGDVLMRVTRNAQSDISHQTFSIISVPQNLTVRWACTDSLLLEWDSVPGADSYEISRLGAQYMDSIATSNNNFFTVTNAQSTNEYWFSVKALNQSQGIVGRRAIAVRKVPGTFLCPLPSDVAVSQLISPQNGQLPSCQKIDSIDVIVEIENRGSTREGNFPVSILMNNGSILTVQFNDTLELYESRVITFPVQADLTGSNFHTFKAWTDLTNDSQRQNDTSTVNVSTYGSQSFNLPFNQNFDLFAQCPTTTNCEATVCNLFDGWLNQINNIDDDIDWRTNSGGTASGGTGPSTDVSGNGNYLYLEASGNPICADKTAVLMSPCIDLGFAIQPELRFWYHMLGASIGELHIDILADGNWYMDATAPLIGAQGSLWQERVVDLTQFAGQTINIRFRGTTGNGFTSDIAIDEISVTDNFVYAIDAAVTKILSPSFTTKEDCLTPDSLDVTVVIQNTGANPLGNLPMRYSVNGAPAMMGTYSNIMQSGDIDTFTFANALNIPSAGNYDLKVWQDYGPDLNPGNDSLSTSMIITQGTLASIPYSQTFDAFGNCGVTANCEAEVCNLSAGWKNYQNNQDDDIDWRVHNGATPSQNTGPANDQNQGNSAGKYLYLEVSGGCNNRVAILESPCIDLTTSFSPELKLWYHMFGSDMGELHLDVFLGDSWFNDFAPPIIGNQGNSWQQWTVDMTLLAGNIVAFRLRGISDVGFMGDIAIDNISINDNFTAPQAAFSFSQPTCSGQNIVFTDNSTGSGMNYNWDFGANAIPASATGPGPHNVTFLKSGIESVSLIVDNVGGVDTSTQSILFDTIPQVGFSFNVNGDTVSFLNQSSNASTYVWDFGDGTVDSTLQPIHIFSNPGIYTVTLTVGNGCGVNIISKDVTIGMVGIKDLSSNNLRVYPNPSFGFLTIEGLSNKSLDKLQVELSDLKGARLSNFTKRIAGDKVILDINQLPIGLYILKLHNSNLNTVMKIEKN